MMKLLLLEFREITESVRTMETVPFIFPYIAQVSNMPANKLQPKLNEIKNSYFRALQ